MLNSTKVAGSTAALAAAAAATAAGSTNAAAQGHAPQVSNWDGVFIGGSFGGSWLSSSPHGQSAQITKRGYSAFGQTFTGGFESVGDTSATNVIGGLQAGFNWQSGRNVFGVEGDFSWLGKNNANAGGNVSLSQVGYPNNYTGTTFRESRVNAVATFRGRFGYDFNGTMPYITMGLAVGQIKSAWSFNTAYAGTFAGVATRAAAQKTSWEPGFVVGGGVEQKLTRNWSVRADVQWMRFATQKIDNPIFNATYGGVTGNGGTINFQNSLTIARLGINYRF